ncbi:UDP-N-acetylmuramoyl-L-alanine--D-glutamate ligase [bacterium]|nr:UDP-N-acetylmuramoyl-L-alanine--D-glutamate ligase [bacterium]
MNPFNGKKIVVIGAARSGIAAAKLVKRHGASVFVSDIASSESKASEVNSLKSENIPYEFGVHSARVTDADMIIISPGVPRTGSIFTEIATRHIPIYSELEIASWMLSSSLIAVTGTNGKTTTTTLIGEIFKASGRPTLVAGNIGTALSDCVESGVAGGTAVVEVSSFQAEGFLNFCPHIGVLLNLSPDHMDRYESVETYYAAKRKTFENQRSEDFIVYNADDPAVNKLIEGLRSRKIPFSLTNEIEYGAYVHNDSIICILDQGKEMIIETGKIGLRGKHNLANTIAATLVAKLAGIETSIVRDTLIQFKGVEHRLEFVREINGVKFYNDSKATNVDSTFFALDSFKQEKIILIAGGKHKGAPYTPLSELVKKKVKALVLIGEAALLIENDLGQLTKAIRSASIQDAVQRAFNEAANGDVVLLSPACASYDMFKNYEDRGQQFKQAVNGL